MHNLTFDKNQAISILKETASNEFAVDFDLVWQWLGFSRKDNAKRRFMRSGFAESLDYSHFLLKEKNLAGGRPEEKLYLTVDCVKAFCMMANTSQGVLVRSYFIEAEKELRQVKEQKPKTALELAREQVKLLEQIELQSLIIQEQEQDLLRQAEVIDELFDYSSIIRIAKYNNCSEKAFSWRKLKTASIAMHREIKQVPCPRFQVKNLYRHDVWRFVYPDFKLPETTTLVIKSEK